MTFLFVFFSGFIVSKKDILKAIPVRWDILSRDGGSGPSQQKEAEYKNENSASHFGPTVKAKNKSTILPLHV